ncbi:MAG: energy transducer TonB [Acidobacteria bacterium]|nr:energy transducer TonB [Acidobacteriota bacterium]
MRTWRHIRLVYGTTHSDGGELDFVSRGSTPRYPHIAANARLTGVVVLELQIDGEGNVDPHPLSGGMSH